ncbi:type II toxin-antitoxin system VapC family toxin [Armatimonas sp.]|uniref:type II toxin-antitoxin system VapC family toxin n=1 Tax=Armatimonas sp. TaxID=1872638 RepID=UPI003753194F
MSRLTEAFLDAAYAIALAAPGDQFHAKAEKLAEQMEHDGTKLITTRAVLLEIGNALGKQRYRADAVALLEALEADPGVEIMPLTEDLFARAFQLYCSRPDKEWGLIDCVSFTVMQEQGILAALTTDDHFQQAGFRVLLRES